MLHSRRARYPSKRRGHQQQFSISTHSPDHSPEHYTAFVIVFRSRSFGPGERGRPLKSHRSGMRGVARDIRRARARRSFSYIYTAELLSNTGQPTTKSMNSYTDHRIQMPRLLTQSTQYSRLTTNCTWVCA